MEILLATLVGLIAGIWIGILVSQNKRQALQSQTEVLKAQVENEKTHAQAMLAAQEERHKEGMAALQARFDETMNTMKALKKQLPKAKPTNPSAFITTVRTGEALRSFAASSLSKVSV